MEGSNLPLKQEEFPLLTPPVIYNQLKDQLPGTSDHDHTDTIESSSSKQCETTFSGLEPPSVKTSQNEKYKDQAVDIARLLSSKDTHLGKGQWPHLYQMVGGPKFNGPLRDSLSRAKDKLMVSIRENSRVGKNETWNLRNVKTKQVDESGRVGIDVMHEKNLNSESALLPQDARLKILSTSSFSHFFGKKTAKGNGVISRQQVDKTDLDGDCNMEMNVKMPHFSDMSDNHAGVILREWLKPGHCVKNKVLSLEIFRQVVELFSLAHSQGLVMQQLRPSFFTISPSNKVKYIGSTQVDMHVVMSSVGGKKRLPDEDISAFCTPDMKVQKLMKDVKYQNLPSTATISTGVKITSVSYDSCSSSCTFNGDNSALGLLSRWVTRLEEGSSLTDNQLEEEWYASPEEHEEKVYKVSSNIYCLGVLLFELLCSFDSMESHSAAMTDIQHRILPPLFLSENPREAGFCLWLIHPDPASRPTIREILGSDIFSESQELSSCDELAMLADDVELAESELLLDFLVSLKEKKADRAVKLVEDIRCIEGDIKGLLDQSSYKTSSLHADRDCNYQDFITSIAKSGRNDDRLRNDMSQLEKAYFSLRTQNTITNGVGRADKDLLNKRETWSLLQNQNDMTSMIQRSLSGLDVFFEGLCKFTCYNKLKLKGTLRNGDLLNSANVICSLSFDRDEEYIAVTGASKRIKIFEYSALLNDSIDIHYPVIEMGNKSKLSCISWNGYIRNYLASTDYEGVVQVWDASTGIGYSQHNEHQKRAWSIDFSRVDPTRFASGSDDCSVKLWCTNEKKSACTILSPANVCCVQYSPYSSHLLMFGSADHKIYGYDLRHMRIPWCTLAGHEKTVSYVKFLDSETVVSASTDNTLKLWDLSKTSLSGISSEACRLTFSGHTNKKHFVGLSVLDGYIACGSESNEVFTYYRSLPMPITSYKLSSIHPISQQDVREEDGLFVSSVCWRSKSNTILAANSSGSVRLLQPV